MTFDELTVGDLVTYTCSNDPDDTASLILEIERSDNRRCRITLFLVSNDDSFVMTVIRRLDDKIPVWLDENETCRVFRQGEVILEETRCPL